MRGLARYLAAMAVLLVVGLYSSRASATTYPPGPGYMKICLRLDASGFVDLSTGTLGTGPNWIARGIETQVTNSGGSVVRSWWPVDADDGCFTMLALPGYYGFWVKPSSGTLGGNNTIEVLDSSGSLPSFVSVAYVSGISQATYTITLVEEDELRVYAALAYAIHKRFRGQYQGEDLTAFVGASPAVHLCSTSCTSKTSCFCPQSSGPVLNIGSGGSSLSGGDHHKRKFVIIHEYGHANHLYGAADYRPEHCDLDGDGHRLRGREYSTCAAVEGWAHFVSGDVFNTHAGSGSYNPQAELLYLDDGEWNLGSGNGQCPPLPLDPYTTYPSNSPLKMWTNCYLGTSTTIGVEMDWARLFWDYHNDTSLGSNTRGHSQLHDDLAASGSWTVITAYTTIRDSLAQSLRDRWKDAAEWNGVCITSSC